MAAFTSTGGVINWGGNTLTPRSISFNSASAETVTIPWLHSGKNSPPVVVPTGDFQGGGISVEYTRDLSGGSMTSLVGAALPWTYSDDKGYSLSASSMLLVSCTENVSTGSVVTGTLEFVLTSFSGNNWN